MQEIISELKLQSLTLVVLSLKDKIILQDGGRQVEARILEARHLRQQHLQNVAERAQKSRHSQAEVVRRKKALDVSRGKCVLPITGQESIIAIFYYLFLRD